MSLVYTKAPPKPLDALEIHTRVHTHVQAQAHTQINSPQPLVPPNCTLANLTSCISWSQEPETICRSSVVIFGALPNTGSSPTCRPSPEPEVGLCNHSRLYCIWHSWHLWNPPFKFWANHFLTVLHKADILGSMIGKMSCRLLFKFLSPWLAPVLSSSLSSQSPILSHVTNNNTSRIASFSFSNFVFYRIKPTKPSSHQLCKWMLPVM